jgi:hypothetical protein
METQLIPNFTYEDETNLLCLAALGLAHAKELAEINPNYWNDRAETFETVLDKLQVEVRNSYTLK